MAESIIVSRKKARDRTARWRNRTAGVPEARQIDRALVVALVRMIIIEKVVVDRQSMLRLLHLAVGVLARQFDRQVATLALAERISKLKAADEIGLIMRWKEYDRVD